MSGVVILCWFEIGSGFISEDALLDKASTFAACLVEALQLQGLILLSDHLPFVYNRHRRGFRPSSIDNSSILCNPSIILSVDYVFKFCNSLGQKLVSLGHSSTSKQSWFPSLFYSFCNINPSLYYFDYCVI